MFKCKCGREFEKSGSLRNHGRFCEVYEKKKQPSKYKIKTDLYRCECKKEFSNPQSLLAHFSHCLIHNPNKKRICSFTKEQNGWAKGLTKETDERVAKYSETLKNKYASGEILPHCTPHTDETKNHLSEVRTLLLENSGGRCKWFTVFNGEKEIKVQGNYERIVAEQLTKQNIKWERKYIIYSKIKRYTPDFYLPELNIYIETKGWWSDRDINKMNLVLKEHDIDLRIIDSFKQIKEIEKGNLNVQVLERYTEMSQKLPPLLD